MDRIVSVADALRCAIQTAQEQPREVPEAPAGWAAAAQTALDAGDAEQIQACADQILRAHGQYRAEFDIKGWLYDLRNAVRNAPAHAAAAKAVQNVIARSHAQVLGAGKAEFLPQINFEGTLVTPRNGKYKCPHSCHNPKFPTPSWKTADGFRKHMETCSCSPSARKRQAEEAAQRNCSAEELAAAAAAKAGLAVGDEIFYTGYTVTGPTHVMRGTRRVRVRYQELRSYFGASTRIQSFGWAGGLVINGSIAPRDLCDSLEAAKAQAQERERDYQANLEAAAATV